MNGEAKQEAVRQRLDELAARGALTARDVVLDARKKDSPLHGYFEWDNAKAATKFRLVQARRLINRFQVPIIEESRILVTKYAVRDPSAAQGQQGYVRTADLQTDQGRARAVLLGEVKRLTSHLTRVQALALAFGMEEEVLEITSRVEELQLRLQAA